MGSACAGENAANAKPVEVVPDKVEPPPPPPKPETKLSIRIIGAHGIRNSDWLPGLGKPDCYCVLKSGNNELFTTKVLDNTMEPCWNESTEVMEYTHGEPLEFSVWDKDQVGSDFLGKCVLQSSQFTEGFNGEVQLEDAGKDIRAFLKIQICPTGKVLPPGPPSEFEVKIDKKGATKLGLTIDTQDGKLLYVTGIEAGPFIDYNRTASPAHQVMPTDFIVSVNGTTGSASALLEKLKQDNVLNLVLSRAVVVPVVIEKTGALGVEFPPAPSGTALVITKIVEGAFKQYNDNTKDENMKVLVGDRIVAVQGKEGRALDIMNNLNKSIGKFQLKLHRPAKRVESDQTTLSHWRFWN